MQAVYVDKDIPRVLLTKAIAPLWPDFVWTPFSSARAGSLPAAVLPGPRWLRVRNIACGICATDLSLLYARADPSVPPAALPGLRRFFLGHEAVGQVTEVGQGVGRFHVGDRVIMDKHFYGANCLNLEVEPCEMCRKGETVFCLRKSEYSYAGVGGGYGDEYVTHETSIHPCPEELSLDQAVLVEPLGIGAHAVLRHPPAEGDKVLVIGAGMIGLSVLMALKAARPTCQVSVLARYDFQSRMAERLGAAQLLSAKDGYAGIAKASGGKFFSAPLNRGVVTGGFDMIYDCVGTARTLNDAIRWVKALGKLVLVGAHLKPMARMDLVNIWYHQVELAGVVAHGVDDLQGQKKHTYDWIFEFMQRGDYPIEGLITHRFPYSHFKEAIRVSAGHKRKPQAVKVILQAGI